LRLREEVLDGYPTYAAYRLVKMLVKISGWKAVGGWIIAFFVFSVPLILGAYYYYMGAQKDAESP